MSIMGGALWNQRSKDLTEAMEARQREREQQERYRRRDL
jgi:hypothetical protein